MMKLTEWVPDSIRVRAIPVEQGFVQLPVPNENSSNCVSCVFWQFPSEKMDLARLFAHCVEETLFDQLRTKRQLGYVGWSFFEYIAGSASFTVIVQSNSVALPSRVDV